MDLSFGDCPDHRPLPLDKTRGASHRRSSFSGPSPRSDREVPQLVGGRRRRRGRRWLSVRCRSEALRLAPGVHHADSLLFVPSFVTHARSARGDVIEELLDRVGQRSRIATVHVVPGSGNGLSSSHHRSVCQPGQRVSGPCTWLAIGARDRGAPHKPCRHRGSAHTVVSTATEQAHRDPCFSE
jgi:hypothetical protein